MSHAPLLSHASAHAVPPREPLRQVKSDSDLIIGNRGTYRLVTELGHDAIESIGRQTALRINLAPGQSSTKVVTQWTESTRGKICLGRGSSGLLCIAQGESDGRYYGIKVTRGEQGIERELAVQASLTGTEQVMQLHDHSRVESPNGETLRYQVMDLAGLGSVRQLKTRLEQVSDLEFKTRLLRHVALGILHAAEALHAKGFCHLDLKPDNLVIDGEGRVKVIDFDCCLQPERGQIHGRSEGDRNYFSPDRWKASYADDQSSQEALFDGFLADSWAVGVTLAELLVPDRHLLPLEDVEQVLELPFEALSAPLKALLTGKERSSRVVWFNTLVESRLTALPQIAGLTPLIRRLMSTDPTARISIEQALADPWLAEVGDDSETRIKLRELSQTLTVETPSTDTDSEDEEEATFSIESPQSLPLPHFSNYLARPDLEAELQRALLSGSMRATLQGAPGCGKTQLAVRAIHRREVRDHFGRVLWFRESDDLVRLGLQFDALAEELGVRRDELFGFIEGQPKPWLLVFDNADDPTILLYYNLPEGLPVLVTTRESEQPDAIRVGNLEPEEGGQLVQKLLGREEPAAARLSEQGGHSPLAIVQACAYIRNQRISIEAYIRLLQTSSDARSAEGRQDGYKPLKYSISGMLELTLRHLRETNALPMLQRVVCLHPDEVPLSVVKKMWRTKDITGQEPPENCVVLYSFAKSVIDEHIEEVVGNLVNYAVLQPSGRGIFRLHQLIRSHLLETLSRDEMLEHLRLALRSLDDAYVANQPTPDQVRLNQLLLRNGELAMNLGLRSQPLLDLKPDFLLVMRIVMVEQARAGQREKCRATAESLEQLLNGTKNPYLHVVCLQSFVQVWAFLGDAPKSAACRLQLDTHYQADRLKDERRTQKYVRQQLKERPGADPEVIAADMRESDADLGYEPQDHGLAGVPPAATALPTATLPLRPAPARICCAIT